jgi:hypothetical protein
LEESEKLLNNPEVQQRLLSLEEINQALMNQGRLVQTIYRDLGMTPDEKRQLIDGIYYGMTETAKAGNEMVREFEMTMKEQEKLLKENNSGE